MAQRRIWESKLRWPEKLVALAIIDHWSARVPEPFPSIARLAKMTGLAPRSVQNAIDGLIKAGIVVVKKNPGRSNSYDLSTVFRPTQDVHGSNVTRASSDNRPTQASSMTHAPRASEGAHRSNQPKPDARPRAREGFGLRLVRQTNAGLWAPTVHRAFRGEVIDPGRDANGNPNTCETPKPERGSGS